MTHDTTEAPSRSWRAVTDLAESALPRIPVAYDQNRGMCRSSGSAGYYCQRPVGHTGRHLAHDGSRAHAVWTDEQVPA